MTPQRRELLRLAGLGVTGALAGCLGLSRQGRETPGSGITAVETHPFAIHSSRPSWDAESEIGYVALLDSAEREERVLGSYDLPEERTEALDEFKANLDYETERLLFVESVGPNACHDRLDVTNVRLADGRLRADAEVLDTSEDDVGCAEVISYPSTLARVTFEEAPPGSAAVDLTDGWGESAAISSAETGSQR